MSTKVATVEALDPAKGADRPLPSSVRIGHLTYSVVVSQAMSDQQAARDRTQYAGHMSMASQMIVLAERNQADGEPFGAGYMRDTVLHEVLHGCLRAAGCDPDADAKAGLADVEERAVSSMTGPLLAALRDNPDLLAYLIEGPA